MLRTMSRAAGVDDGAGSTTTFGALRNSTFRAIWFAAQVPSLGWLMQAVAVRLVRVGRGSRRQFQSSQGDVKRLLPYGPSLCDANRCCGAGICQSVDDPRLQLPDRMWRRSQRSGLTSLCWRHRGPTRCTGSRDPALRRFQHRPFRRSGPRRHRGSLLWALAAIAVTTLTYLVPLATTWRCKWKVRSSPLPRVSMWNAIYDGLRFTAKSSESRLRTRAGPSLARRASPYSHCYR